jgi:hypothetical protein
MARGEKKDVPPPLRACCLVSEMLEEAGLDRQKARQLRRQLLEGMILLCRWQLERMERPAPSGSRKSARKVAVE